MTMNVSAEPSLSPLLFGLSRTCRSKAEAMNLTAPSARLHCSIHFFYGVAARWLVSDASEGRSILSVTTEKHDSGAARNRFQKKCRVFRDCASPCLPHTNNYVLLHWAGTG